MRQVLLTIIFLAVAGPAWATTFYMAPALPPPGWSAGRDSNDGLSMAAPKLTLRGAFAAMRGGDTLVVADGTYSGDANRISDVVPGGITHVAGQLPPSGSAGAYTVVRADHEGGVTFDGGTARAMFRLHGSALSYIEFRGLKWKGAGTGADAFVVSIADLSTNPDAIVHHVKFFRCGAWAPLKSSPFDYFTAWMITGGEYLLFEECYAWGAGRILMNVGGPHSANGALQEKGAKYVVVRRFVARPDEAHAIDASAGTESLGVIQCFACSYLEVQNAIIIDTDLSAWAGKQAATGFGVRQGTPPMEPSTNVHLRGSLELNSKGWVRFAGEPANYARSTSVVNQTGTGGSTNGVEHSVMWDVVNGAGPGAPGIAVAGTPSYDHVTMMVAAPPAPDVRQFGFHLPSRWIVRNSVITGKPYYGIGATNGLAPFVYADYNVIWGPTVDYGNYVSRGTRNYSSTGADPRVDPLDGTPGNGVAGLKYILRQEPGSDLHGTGEYGGNRGATVVKRYGVSGTVWGEPGYDTLTGEDLWPFPYEDQIRADMRAYPRYAGGYRTFTWKHAGSLSWPLPRPLARGGTFDARLLIDAVPHTVTARGGGGEFVYDPAYGAGSISRGTYTAPIPIGAAFQFAYAAESGPDPRRGFCADGTGLTDYIWRYLGNTPPVFGVAAAAGELNVTVSWGAPSVTASVSGYKVYLKAGAVWTLVAAVGAGTNAVEVTGLAGGVEREFMVTAVDARLGESGPSDSVLATPLPSTTGGPTAPPPGPDPVVVRGTERLAWTQAGEAQTLRFLAYVDGRPVALSGAVCGGLAAEAACTAPLPPLTDGIHTIALTAIDALSGLESEQSAPITVQKVPSAPNYAGAHLY